VAIKIPQKHSCALWPVFFLGAGLLLFGVGFSILPKEGQTHFVNLGEDGFEPKELIIHKGDTVVFSTTRGEYFWQASNLHPIHELYPEFDSGDPIAPGDSWSFRFDKIGTWRYHDHLYPVFLATIIVMPRD